MKTLMKCSIMLHFIWVFIIWQTTLLGVSSIQRVNSPLSDEFNQDMPLLGPKVLCPVGDMFYIDLYRENIKNETTWPRGLILCLFVCFVALSPKSTAMVMAGQSVHLTTHFLGKLE